MAALVSLVGAVYVVRECWSRRHALWPRRERDLAPRSPAVEPSPAAVDGRRLRYDVPLSYAEAEAIAGLLDWLHVLAPAGNTRTGALLYGQLLRARLDAPRDVNGG